MNLEINMMLYYISQISSYVLAMMFVIIFMNELKKFIFLECNTDKQKKISKRLLWTLSIIMLVSSPAYPALTERTEKFSPGIELLVFIGGILFLFAPFTLGLAAIIYTSVTARKKAKWLGIFIWIPMMGYNSLADALIDIPARQIITFDENSLYYKICTGFLSSLIYILLIGIILFLFHNKKRPEFIRKIEKDIENRSLSFGEELVIWLIGIWMLVYSIIISFTREGIPQWFINIGYLSNFVLGIVVTGSVISSSYRKYYYEKNLKYQKTLITTMATLVESRDDNTGGHIQRTAKYVEIIARKLKREGKFKSLLTDKYIDDMVIAAPLHDVGKIHIPDSILNKPAKLDYEEFEKMKTHSAAGGKIIDQVEKDICENISYLDIAKDMAEYHHERIDGKGYPHGLKGEEIPVCARILAVADVFDALISKRCYKESFPIDKAFKIIREETGDHFDTDIAQAFLNSREEVEQFLKEICDNETAPLIK